MRARLIVLRRCAQFVSLIFLFGIFLFLQKDFIFKTWSAWVFRLDPLIALATSLAAKKILLLFWPAFLVAILTLILGRFFCGWICPMGTLLDVFYFFTKKLPRATFEKSKSLSLLKYILLAVILIAAIFGQSWMGYLNPFSILFHGATAFFPSTRLSYVFAGILFFIFAFEFFERRFWCRYLCPNGALMGWLARFAWLKKIPPRSCAHCNMCARQCRMDAFDERGDFQSENCALCMECVQHCPQNLIRFSWQKPTSIAFEPSRRTFFISLISGLAIPTLAHALSKKITPPLRPPGALPEKDFLQRCVRCGACIQVCPTKCLQPTLLESGIDGAFSPQFTPRIAACRHDCNACTQVCPTKALKPLSLEEKQKFVIGQARVDIEHCLTYQNISCLDCVKACPVGAIEFHAGHPRVVPSKCIGCGACENICPAQGAVAIELRGSAS